MKDSRFFTVFFVYLLIPTSWIGAQPWEPSDSGLSDSEILAGWLSLFDNESSFGWHAEVDANWKFESGEITVDSGKVGLLRTSAQFDDFDLRLEVKTEPRTNSGIFFRTSPRPTDPTVDCFEFNLAHRSDSPFPTGSLVGRVSCEVDFDLSQWTQIRILCQGRRIRCWVDETKTCDYTAPPGKELGRGYLGLQHNSGQASFRKIRLLPLNVTELKIDPSLEDWQQSQTRVSQIEVDTNSNPAELKLRGGPGQLETKQQFADFICQLQAKTGGENMNSGIFFRCIPGEFMNGYESQIHNQIKNNDRTQPVDFGTGGIFRRVNARLVNAADKQWFSKTIIACGANVSVWVNGLQVTDWTDRRPPHVNPRKGRRLEAGTIILQGHDPETDMSFREIRIRELQKRVR